MASPTCCRSSVDKADNRLCASVVRDRSPIVIWYVRPSSRKRSREISIAKGYCEPQVPLYCGANASKTLPLMPPMPR